MADFKSDETGEGAEGTENAKAEGISEQIRADIQLGNLDGDVETEVAQRMAESGVDMSAEDARTLATDIENDADR